jgi:hypothetical protein
MQWIGLMINCGMAVKRMEMLGECDKDKGTDCEDADSDTDW